MFVRPEQKQIFVFFQCDAAVACGVPVVSLSFSALSVS